MPRREDQFQTVRSEGAILPPDLLQRISAGELEGLEPATYHLPSGMKTKEAISQAWTQLLKYWRDFKAARQAVSNSDETATKTTNDKWLLPLFQELGYGRLTTAKSPEIAGKVYPIERFWTHVPIHLIGFKLSLDHRTKGARGAATAIPHSMVQEFLNRSPGHMWAFLSNGLQLRILRDNAALSRQAYVEFDLESMMDGEVYADFALLWLVCHQSRLEADKPENCWLEKWSKSAQDQGTRMLNELRLGVAKAIELLGRGFIAHPANGQLLEKLQSGKLGRDDYYRQILRIVYRLLFLFVAEDRGLLHPPPPQDARERELFEKASSNYDRFYSTRRLRDLAESYRGSKHADLWHGLSLVFDALGRDEGCPALALPALGSFLWSPTATPDLAGPQSNGNTLYGAPVLMRNEDLLDAVRALAFVEKGKVLRSVDYRNLGSEELGSVYESLLELHPDINVPGRTFTLSTAAGNERKTSGSYYTPDSLVQCLLDSALEPVVSDAIKGKSGQEAAIAILKLKVCDPAVGSGHFLIAAAHRLARHLARARSGESEPSPQQYQHALRDVIGHCLYGVDLNPMAVELCKVSLWMEAIEPGRPLSFLDHRIQTGNSLLGATPALLSRGIPDEAFEPIEGDDKAYCREWKKQNKEERKKHQQLLLYRDAVEKPWEKLGNLAASLVQLDSLPDESIEDVRTKEQRYSDLVRSGAYESGRFLADMWCAAFVWNKTKEFDYPITEKVFRDVERNPRSVAPWMRDEVVRLRERYKFFHWHLAFPDAFQPQNGDGADDARGWVGGYETILGNPPWDKIQPEAPKFFATSAPEIATAKTGAERELLIAELETSDQRLFSAWNSYRREIEGISSLLKHGLFRPAAHGNVNLYRVFGYASSVLLSQHGQAGMIVQSGFLTDGQGSDLMLRLIRRGQLISAFDFENRENFFPNVDTRFRFALIVLAGSSSSESTIEHATRFAWMLQNVAELNDPERTFTLTADEILSLAPDEPTAPVLRSRREFEIARRAYRRGVYIKTSKGQFCDLRLLGEFFNMTRDSRLFKRRSDTTASEFVPLYESKYFHQFDHRHGTWDGHDVQEVAPASKRDTAKSIVTKYYVPNGPFEERCIRVGMGHQKWLIAIRDVSSATNERTTIAAILPKFAVGHNSNVIHGIAPKSAALLVANLNSFALDYLSRQRVSGMHVTLSILGQLPVIPLAVWERSTIGRDKRSLSDWAVSRVVELTYTSDDIAAFAQDCGYNGRPIVWNADSRFAIACELNAAFFHLYGIDRNDLSYILDGFPIVKRKDIEVHGAYRTKDAILAAYDDLAKTLQIQAKVEVPTLTACELMVLILDEWDKPVHRQAADRALILALNDNLRAQILEAAPSRTAPPAPASTLNARFDIVWKTLQAMKLVELETTATSVKVSRLPATIRATDPNNAARARDAVKAFGMVEQQRAAWPDGIDDLEYAFS